MSMRWPASEYGWAASTVKTLLRRLVEKGFLTYSQVGNSFLYRPGAAAAQVAVRRGRRPSANALDGTVGPLLAYMVKRSKLSPDELSQLRELNKTDLRSRGQDPQPQICSCWRLDALSVILSVAIKFVEKGFQMDTR